MRRWWLAIGIGVALLLAWFGYRYYEANLKVEPETLLYQALEKTLAVPSYRYEVEAELIVAGKNKVLSKVTGERDRQGNFHLWGELSGEKVEVYQIEDTTYLLDSKSGKWLVVPGNELGRQKMLMAEIDPLSNLQFKSFGPVTYRGRENRMYVLEFRPQLASEFMNTWFQNFSYRVWIERRTHWLRQAVIAAQSKTNPEVQATFTIRLYDFGVKLKLDPPT